MMNSFAVIWSCIVILGLLGLFGWACWSYASNISAEEWLKKHSNSLSRQLGAWNLRLVMREDESSIISINTGKNGEYTTGNISFRKIEKIIDEMQNSDETPYVVFMRHAKKRKPLKIKQEKPSPKIGKKHL